MPRLATVPDLPGAATAEGVAPRRPTRTRPVTGTATGRRGRARSLLALAGHALLVAALVRGWQLREAFPFTAEHGIGYALGILGGSMMLLLLVYPLRKRLPRLRFLGPVPFWFRLHMLFGLLGPLCILYHAGFHLGSTNANAALFCMLTVATSGLVGRYLYTRIHLGLYGRRATAAALRKQIQTMQEQLAASSSEGAEAGKEVLAALQALETRILREGMPGSRVLAFLLPPLSRYLLYRQVMALLAPVHPAGTQAVEVRRLARQMSRTFLQLSQLRPFERLFSLWHLLHLPLFLLMVVSGIVHVVFVHMY
ncbi:MAG: hypothetical protein D6721_03935 [Gammaproteobacteria bacterium]|nr:MAG: hypothetical protein D6721_03935 [Gammaproteobacteria bacterium]